MALCDQCYPKGLAFAFLGDVIWAFQEELKREFGTFSIDYQSRIDTIEKPYYFIHFDRTIKKLRDEYRDSNSSRSLHRLNHSLCQVAGIMHQNIDDLLLRGENLSTVTKKGDDLKVASKGFVWTAASLNMQAMMMKYRALAMILICIMLVFALRWSGFNGMLTMMGFVLASATLAAVTVLRRSGKNVASPAKLMQCQWNLANEA
jgi:vesicle transport protein SEC22